jgi:hypothetical protein
MDRFGQQALPVIISVLIILIVAIARSYSRTLAAVLSTMPLTIPLSLWVVYSGVGGDRSAMAQFTGALVPSILATVCFTVAVWLAARAGWRLLPMIAGGYATWVVCLGVILALRHWLKG